MRRWRSARDLVIADQPIGDLALDRDDLLVLWVRAVGVEIGTRRKRHVHAEIVRDRAIRRIPAVFEAYDAAAVLRQRLEAGFPGLYTRVVPRDARLELDQHQVNEHRRSPGLDLASRRPSNRFRGSPRV